LGNAPIREKFVASYRGKAGLPLRDTHAGLRPKSREICAISQSQHDSSCYSSETERKMTAFRDSMREPRRQLVAEQLTLAVHASKLWQI
jgi:hypothetical protein